MRKCENCGCEIEPGNDEYEGSPYFQVLDEYGNTVTVCEDCLDAFARCENNGHVAFDRDPEGAEGEAVGTCASCGCTLYSGSDHWHGDDFYEIVSPRGDDVYTVCPECARRYYARQD